VRFITLLKILEEGFGVERILTRLLIDTVCEPAASEQIVTLPGVKVQACLWHGVEGLLDVATDRSTDLWY
jgi:hypothetical protein